MRRFSRFFIFRILSQEWMDLQSHNGQAHLRGRASLQRVDSKAWWKLLPKPAVFDHATRESEIAGWKEWSWSFEQYMASIDPKFMDDIQQVRTRLDKQVDPIDFTDAERQRNSFFYSLLSSLMRQRSLLVVKQVEGNNGLEA